MSFKKNKYSPCNVKLVKDLDLIKTRGITRGGVVLYTRWNEELYLIFAKDSFTHDITDFGGIKSKRLDNSIVDTALREFDEETLGIFQKLTPEDVQDSVCVYDHDTLIILIRIDLDPNEICKKFNEKAKKFEIKKLEVCSIFPIKFHDFISCMTVPAANAKSNVFYHRTESLLRKIDNILMIL